MPRVMVLAWPVLRVPEEAPIFEEVLDLLDELSPRVEPLTEGVALLDVTGLGTLFGDERRIAQRAAALARAATRRRLALRAGAGDSRWLASLAARLAAPDPKLAFGAVLPGMGRSFCAPLPIDLLPADLPTRQRLALFGLTRMGELAELPRSAVGAQLGAAGERLQALARGEDPRPIVPRARPEQVASRIAFDPPLDELGGIALGLRRCCAELCERLRLRGFSSGRAVLHLELEDGLPLRVELTFPEPTLEPDWITRLLLGRLETALRREKVPFTNPIGERHGSGRRFDVGHRKNTRKYLQNGYRDRENLGGGARFTNRLGKPSNLEPIHDGEPRVVGIGLVLDRLSNAEGRQLPAFEPRFRRWQELWPHLERITARFGDGRLWRAHHDRPNASLPERRSRLGEIGPQA